MVSIMSNVAFIIGGTGGIGSAIAKLLSEKGIIVYFTYYQNEEKAKEIECSLTNCNAIRCDIVNEEDVRKSVEVVLKKESQIDILINCATNELKLKTFDRLTLEEFSSDLQVIILGSVNIYKQVVPLMKSNRAGVIISLLTSVIEGTPPSRMSSYVTAKSGLSALTKCLAVELGPFNVRVVGISPSFVETDLIKAFPAKLLEIEREKRLDKSLLHPEDIARVALYITQNPKKYPNGKNIKILTREDLQQYEN